MNKAYVLAHLKEAREAVDQLIADMQAEGDYDYGEFRVDMEHLYHHINTAWNARDASPESADACSQEDFDRWRKFPQDIELTS
jgi:predicted transposase YbfD/YdcC